MPLSDYLNNNEFDACVYASFGKSPAKRFGDSIRITIKAMLNSGYKFQGFDSNGKEIKKVSKGNHERFLKALFGKNQDILKIIENGRSFMQIHCNDLISETDKEFEKTMNELILCEHV